MRRASQTSGVMAPVLLFITIIIGNTNGSNEIKGKKDNCSITPILGSNQVEMRFSLAEEVNLEGDPDLLIRITKEGERGDILRCDREHPSSNLTCVVLDERFESQGLVGHSVSLLIPDESAALQHVYSLRVACNGAFLPVRDCKLDPFTKDDGRPEEPANTNVLRYVWVCVSTVLFVFLIFVPVLIVRCREQREWSRTKEVDEENPVVTERLLQDIPRDGLKSGDGEAGKTADFQNVSSFKTGVTTFQFNSGEKESETSKGNVRPVKQGDQEKGDVSHEDTSSFKSADSESRDSIKFEECRSMPSCHDSSSLNDFPSSKSPPTTESTRTDNSDQGCWDESKAIIASAETDNWRKREGLDKPKDKIPHETSASDIFEQADKERPEGLPSIVDSDEMVAGTEGFENSPLISEKLSRTELGKLLTSCPPGSYHISRNIRQPQNCTLAVLVNNKVKTFQIAEKESKFTLLGSGIKFESMSQLVEYYKKHDIRTSDKKIYGRLSKHCDQCRDKTGQTSEKATRQ